MPGIVSSLIVEARMALGLTQEKFGELMGRNKRSIQRWEQAAPVLLLEEVATLARALYPVRPDLAERIAARYETTLEGLGVIQRPAVAPVPADTRVESVLRAAAEAMGVATNTVRPAVEAAFACAQGVGLDVEAVVKGLKGG